MTDLLSFIRRIIHTKTAPTICGREGANFPPYGSPYKFILLLSILRGIRSKKLTKGIVSLNDCVDPFFKVYNNDLEPKYRNSSSSDEMVVQAFWYFGAGTPRFWDLIPVDGQHTVLKRSIHEGTQIKTRKKLEQLVAFAEFSTPDFTLLADPDANETLDHFITAKYFGRST